MAQVFQRLNAGGIHSWIIPVDHNGAEKLPLMEGTGYIIDRDHGFNPIKAQGACGPFHRSDNAIAAGACSHNHGTEPKHGVRILPHLVLGFD